MSSIRQEFNRLTSLEAQRLESSSHDPSYRQAADFLRMFAFPFGPQPEILTEDIENHVLKMAQSGCTERARTVARGSLLTIHNRVYG